MHARSGIGKNSPERAGGWNVAPVVEGEPAACAVADRPGACCYFSWQRIAPRSYSYSWAFRWLPCCRNPYVEP